MATCVGCLVWPLDVARKLDADPRKGDREVRRTLRHALRDAWPAVREFGWRIKQLCELDPADEHVGHSDGKFEQTFPFPLGYFLQGVGGQGKGSQASQDTPEIMQYQRSHPSEHSRNHIIAMQACWPGFGVLKSDVPAAIFEELRNEVCSSFQLACPH